MSDPPLRAHLREPFSASELDAMWRVVAVRRARGVRGRWLRIALPALALGVAALALRPRRAPERTPRADDGVIALEGGAPLPTHADNDGPAERALRLRDRSVISLGPGASLRTVENAPRALTFALDRGDARFAVTPGGPRRWVIRCELATVTVVGTAFSLRQRPGSLAIRVDRGTVWVDGALVPGGHRVLHGGGALALSAPGAPSVAAAPAPPAPAPVLVAPPRPPRAPPTAPSWRLRARAGDAQGAWNALGDNGFEREAARASQPDALLELADVARRSRHHDLAAPLLERFVRSHPTHPEAAMAAFTLGRDERAIRRRPAEAARWFERALSLRPPRSLDEDLRAALADALIDAGRRDAACDAARASIALHPEGRHAERLRALCARR